MTHKIDGITYDLDRMEIRFEDEDDQGEARDVTIKGHGIVCSRCLGKGSHDPDGFSNGFTSEEMDEAGEDFREDYMAGQYDVPCSRCRGARIELEPDRLADRRDVEALQRMIEASCEVDAEMASERRMGA